MEAHLSTRQVPHVVDDLLNEQVVLRRIGNEDGIVLEHEVECARIRFVFDELWSDSIEYLDRAAKTGAQLGVRTQMTGRAGEANQGAMSARLAVDALRIRRGHI